MISANNGAEGLEAFENEKPEIVLTDIKMPGMDGIEVLKKVKALNPDAEVIIITGHGDIENAIEALKYGASDFINKPVRDEALSIALQRAREKLDIRQQLKEYTTDLEKKIAAATLEVRRRSNFQINLIRSSNDGIVATDKDLQVVIYNPGAEKIFGYTPSETLNKLRATDLYPSELAVYFRDALNGLKNIDEVAWRESTIASKGGENIPVLFSGKVLHEKEKAVGTVAFFQDMREIKRLEKELLKSERLAAIGQTVAGLAHGIKNILHGLKGGSYLVDLGIEKNETERLVKGWDMIKRNIGRTSNLAMDLLSYSKEREPELEACFPNEIAGDVCALLLDKARENDIAILLKIDDAIGEVMMDPHTIHEVLLNLLSNAVDACLFDDDMSKNWQVCLKTTQEQDNIITFEITDNGLGMAEEVLQNLFTSFFSTKGHRGTGLGLMVTRKLVDEHGGNIDVTSQRGKGTTFIVRLSYEN